jgi:hypothetical protein
MWLKNSVWDSVFLLGGIWLLPLVAVCSLLPKTLLLLSLILTAVLWLSHRVATFFTIFCTPSYRALITQEPLRFIVIPTLVLLLSVAFALSPYPASPLIRLQALGTIFLLFNTYHFGVQHFGVLTIYRIRSGQQIPESTRMREKAACLLLGGGLVLFGQLLHGADVVRESLIASAIPSYDTSLARWLGIGASLLVGASMLRDERTASSFNVPKTLYKLALTAQALAAFFLPALPFLMLWAVQHWLVSVGLALHMASNSDTETSPERTLGIWWRLWGTINRNPVASGSLLAAVSVVVTPFLLVPTKVISGATSGATLPLLTDWFASHETLTLALVGINFGTVFCHFLYDRAVFRFSHAATRAASGRLLFNHSSTQK